MWQPSGGAWEPSRAEPTTEMNKMTELLLTTMNPDAGSCDPNFPEQNGVMGIGKDPTVLEASTPQLSCLPAARAVLWGQQGGSVLSPQDDQLCHQGRSLASGRDWTLPLWSRRERAPRSQGAPAVGGEER